MFNFLGIVILIESLKFGKIFGIINWRNRISINNIPQHQQYAIMQNQPMINSNVPSAKNISSFGGGYDKPLKMKYEPIQANII